PPTIATLVLGASQLRDYMNTHLTMAVALTLSPIVGTLLLFVTMRRKNSYAALHDLASGTRVVARPVATLRRGAGDEPQIAWAPRSSARARCGPFDVIGEVREVDGGLLLVGFDPVLRRRVWIRAVPSGTPPVSDARRDVGRVGRLH